MGPRGASQHLPKRSTWDGSLSGRIPQRAGSIARDATSGTAATRSSCAPGRAARPSFSPSKRPLLSVETTLGRIARSARAVPGLPPARGAGSRALRRPSTSDRSLRFGLSVCCVNQSALVRVMNCRIPSMISATASVPFANFVGVCAARFRSSAHAVICFASPFEMISLPALRA